MVLGCIGGGASWLVSACVGMLVQDRCRQKKLVIIHTYPVKLCLPGCHVDTLHADVAVDVDGDGWGW